jgi:hypothetical protein
MTLTIECRYAECHYAERCNYLNVMLSVNTLNVVILSVVAPMFMLVLSPLHS